MRCQEALLGHPDLMPRSATLGTRSAPGRRGCPLVMAQRVWPAPRTGSRILAFVSRHVRRNPHRFRPGCLQGEAGMKEGLDGACKHCGGEEKRPLGLSRKSVVATAPRTTGDEFVIARKPAEFLNRAKDGWDGELDPRWDPLVIDFRRRVCAASCPRPQSVAGHPVAPPDPKPMHQGVPPSATIWLGPRRLEVFHASQGSHSRHPRSFPGCYQTATSLDLVEKAIEVVGAVLAGIRCPDRPGLAGCHSFSLTQSPVPSAAA